MLDLTLGIPLYNSEKTIQETLRSVAAQSVRPSHIYLVDDNSPDSSAQLALELIATYKLNNATLLRQPKNRGISGTYNAIAKLSVTKWTQILDADDSLQSGYYEELEAKLSEDATSVALITAMSINVPRLDALTRVASRFVPTRPPLCLPLLGTFATRSGVIYRTRALQAMPFPDPHFDGSDIIHLLQLRRAGGCTFLSRPKVKYRVHPGASTANASVTQYREALREFGALRPFYTADLWCRKTLFSFARRKPQLAQ